MSDRSDSGPSSARTSPAGFAFAAIPVAASPETIVNPERRGVLQGTAPTASGPASSILNRLFPADPQFLPDDGGGPAGFELGHFILEERIGIGGMGAVFRALDTRLQRVVALKVLSPAQSRDLSSVQRFQNEARAAARLDHDNIARVHYIGEDKGLHFIAFEYVTGTNLRDLIREVGPLHPAEAVNYTLQVASALTHTHAAGVVHRDIKPSNIIVAPSGRAKLVDLGLARKVNSDSVGDLTLAGTTLGTFDYISPEQAKDPRNVDVRSDLYSLGCTLYHMLTGEPPYPEGTVLQKLLDHQGSNPPDPAAKNPRVMPELSAIVQKMMASDPRLRYAAPEELIRDLMRIAGALGLRGLPPDGLVWVTPKSEHAPFWKQNVGWVATAALLLLIAFVVGQLPLGHDPQRTTRSDAPGTTGADRIAGPPPANHSGSPPRTSGAPGVDPSAATNDRPQPGRPMVVGHPAPPADGTGILADGDDPLGTDALMNRLADTGIVFRPFGSRFPPLADLPSEPASAPTPPSGAAAPTPPADPPSDPMPPPVAEVMPTEPVVPAPPPEVDATRPFRVIAADGTRTSYPTLQAACEAAKDQSVIELHYGGRRPGQPEKPIRIVDKRLTIKAADDQQRPVLEFAAGGETAGAAAFEPRMISLIDGSVDLINVDLLLTVPSESAADRPWSALALQGEGKLRLWRTTVTVLGPRGASAASDRPSASIIELRPGIGADGPGMGMMNDMTAGAQPVYDVEIEDSLLRGRCDLFRAEHNRSGRLSLRNTAVAVDGALLYAPGSRELSPENAGLELILRHVTCLVGDSLIRMESGLEPLDLLPVTVSTAQYNIFAVRDATDPLVVMTGSTDPNDFRRLLRWNGELNIYDGVERFWIIAGSSGPSDLDLRRFEAWQREWNRGTLTGEKQARNGGLFWREPWRDRHVPFAEIVPKDLELDADRAESPLLWQAPSGDIGASLLRLPVPPMVMVSE